MAEGSISLVSRGLLAAVAAIWFASGAAALAQEVVSFPSLDSALSGGAPTVLRGLLLRPGGAGPFPAVVALHGCTGLFDRQRALVAREADRTRAFRAAQQRRRVDPSAAVSDADLRPGSAACVRHRRRCNSNPALLRGRQPVLRAASLGRGRHPAAVGQAAAPLLGAFP
jgi:hypothetical protein